MAQKRKNKEKIKTKASCAQKSHPCNSPWKQFGRKKWEL